MAAAKSINWILVAAGAVSFVAAHVVLRAAWPAFDPGGAHRAWFLNSGRAVAFAAAWLAATGWLAVWLADSNRVGAPPAAARAGDPNVLARGAAVATGAVLAMIAVLVTVGPGTLFPIAIVIGGCIVIAAVLIGAIAAARLGRR